MTRLSDLQEGFQRAVLEHDRAILDHLRDSSKQTRDVLFDVYRLGYSGRLVDVLGSEYEILKAWLGDDFADMGQAYVAAHPSDVRNARWFGRHLPVFLASRVHDAATQVTADIASLELALSDAFDAPDAEALDLSDLSAIAPEDWPSLTFSPHPSARRIDLRSNAVDIWDALRAEDVPPEPRLLLEPTRLIIWRQQLSSRFRLMPEDEVMMWAEACKGVAFSVLCEMIAMYGGEEGAELRAASHLKGWLDAGLLARR